MSDFQPGLSAATVHQSLLNACRQYRRAEQHVVLWLAEVKERRLYRQLGYGSIHQYAEQALEFSRSKTFQLLRLVDSLKRLPRLQEAVAHGQIGWTKAREVAKVATPRTEKKWIAAARGSSRRELEKQVARTKRRAAQQNPAQVELGVDTPSQVEATEVPVSLTLQMTSLQRAQFEALLEKIRKSGGTLAGASREEILLAALANLVQPDASSQSSAPGCTGLAGSIWLY